VLLASACPVSHSLPTQESDVAQHTRHRAPREIAVTLPVALAVEDRGTQFRDMEVGCISSGAIEGRLEGDISRRGSTPQRAAAFLQRSALRQVRRFVNVFQNLFDYPR
jgi:hypothetical protein